MKKRLFSTCVMLVLLSVSMWADGHWTLSHQGEGASTQTVVYATLDLNNNSLVPDNYEVAAFVGEEVRAIATSAGVNEFTLMVNGNYDSQGEADNGKEITFKLFNKVSDIEYDLTPASIVTFDGTMYGSPSTRLVLSAIEVTSISIDDFTMEKEAVQDLNDLLILTPGNATKPNNINWNVAGYEEWLSVTNDGMLTALKVGNAQVYYGCGGSIAGAANVTIKCTATAMKVNSGYEIITVSVGDDDDLTNKLAAAITLTPADATDNIFWESSNEAIVYQQMTNMKWHPEAIGEVIMTAQTKDEKGNVILSAQLTVKVVADVTALDMVVPAVLVVGRQQQLIVNVTPANADIDVNNLSHTLSLSTLPAGWDIISIDNVAYSAGVITYTVTTNYPGSVSMQVNYGSVKTSQNTLTCGVPVNLSEGWQWKSLWADVASGDMKTVFTNDLIEIRSQSSLMANDATYGYFGPLFDNGLVANTAYKIHMNMDVAEGNTYIQENGGTWLSKNTIQNRLKAWTWIGYPYYNSYNVSAINFNATAGDRIVSQTDGFCEYDGTAWTGTLTKLRPRQAYLYYNNSGSANNFTWENEPDLYTANLPTAGSPAMAKRVKQSSVWTYDARRFRDNMSMVAVVNNVDQLEECTIGVFVGDECRGEGCMVGDKMFITIYGEPGETAQFRLYNARTDAFIDILETASLNMLMGSLSQPVILTVAEKNITDIYQLRDSSQPVVSYDLSGRRINGLQHGIVIERMANGSFRKVIRK